MLVVKVKIGCSSKSQIPEQLYLLKHLYCEASQHHEPFVQSPPEFNNQPLSLNFFSSTETTRADLLKLKTLHKHRNPQHVPSQVAAVFPFDSRTSFFSSYVLPPLKEQVCVFLNINPLVVRCFVLSACVWSGGSLGDPYAHTPPRIAI